MAAEKVKYNDHIINFSSSNGYPTIFINGKNVLLHRYVWEINNGPIPNGYEIHHKDKNRLNYNLSNLELIKIKDHHRKHAIENKLGLSNKGREKTHVSGFCGEARKIILYNDVDELKFNSISAAERFLNVHEGSVSRVLRGERETIKGWKCKYNLGGV